MNVPLLPGRIEHWPLARLKPYARNAKTHDADQVAKIAASMAEFGWTVPVLVAADGELIAGHGRILAAAHLGLSDAPVHRDNEWQHYWEGWVEWMRASGWRRFGWYVWDQGPGLPGDWNGRLAPSHEFIFHFNRSPRKPHKTVPSKHAGETLGGGGLRGAGGTVHAKTGTGNAIQSHSIPDSVFRVMRHKGGLGAAGLACIAKS